MNKTTFFSPTPRFTHVEQGYYGTIAFWFGGLYELQQRALIDWMYHSSTFGDFIYSNTIISHDHP